MITVENYSANRIIINSQSIVGGVWIVGFSDDRVDPSRGGHAEVRELIKINCN